MEPEVPWVAGWGRICCGPGSIMQYGSSITILMSLAKGHDAGDASRVTVMTHPRNSALANETQYAVVQPYWAAHLHTLGLVTRALIHGCVITAPWS